MTTATQQLHPSQNFATTEALKTHIQSIAGHEDSGVLFFRTSRAYDKYAPRGSNVQTGDAWVMDPNTREYNLIIFTVTAPTYRNIIRIVTVQDTGILGIIIPAWDHTSVIHLPLSLVLECLPKFEPKEGDRLIAKVDWTGAENPQDLRFSKFEIAPPLDLP